MFRLAKVRHGGEHYYFQTVRASTDRPDGLIEADPYWLGRGAASLGLSGTPTRLEVAGLFAGADPSTGELLLQPNRAVSNVAYDLTFSVPKSVSLVHALAGPRATARIQQAHERAVGAVVGYLEREVLVANRSEQGARFTTSIEGASAVGFLHRTSRANDPHLHTHVLVANLACGPDGRWSALDARRLFRSQRAVRALFESQLRVELSSLGIEFGPMRRDFADIASISRATVREFSRQSRAVEAAMQAEGLRGPQAAVLVAQAIRPRKDRSRPYEELRLEWQERGLRMGLSQRRIDRAAGLGAELAVPPNDTARSLSSAGSRKWVESVRTGLDGSCTRDDLLVACAVASRQGTDIAEVEREVSKATNEGQLVRKEERYVLASRRRALQAASERIGRSAASLEVTVLTADHSGGRLAMLDALARLAAERCAEGGRVVALSPGERAARCFEAASGIEAFSVKRADELAAELTSHDLVVVADCGVMLEHELSESLGLCRASGATPLLVGSEASVGSSLLLDGVRSAAQAPLVGEPRPAETVRMAFGPRASAVLVQDPSAACAEALALSGALEGTGRQVVIVVPDRSFREHLTKGATFAARERAPFVVGSRQLDRALGEVSEQARGRTTAVIIGGAGALELDAERLARLERTHVLVAANRPVSLGVVAEAVRPAHLSRVLGASGPGPSTRARWREAALLIETYRGRHGLTASPTTYGRRGPERGPGREEELVRRRVAETLSLRDLDGTERRRSGVSRTITK